MIYKIMLFCMLFVPIFFGSVEINIIMSLFFIVTIFILSKNKLSKNILNVLLPLFGIMFIAGFSSLFYKNTLYDVIKDIIYLLKPILFILLGYFLVKKVIEKDYFFRLIIYVAIFFAIIHLYQVFLYLFDNPFSVNKIRGVAGKDNFIELVAIILMLSNKEQEIFQFKLKSFRYLKWIIYCSAILYFSRTMFVTGIILLLSIKGYTKLTKKGILYISIFIGLVLLSYLFLTIADIDRTSVGIEGFLYKLKIAPAEIFSAKTDINNHATLWDHWRGYEALKAFEQLYETKYHLGLLLGKGFGSLVDLGFVAPLNFEGMQFISHLHNGYAFIMYKSGGIGIFSYLLFLGYLYLFSYQQQPSFKIGYINNTISGIALFYVFTTLVITGIYSKSDTMTVILGAFLYLQHFYTKQHNTT